MGYKVEDSSYDSQPHKRPGTAVIGPEDDEDDDEEAAAAARRGAQRTQGESSYIELDEPDEWGDDDEMDLARKEEAKRAAVEALSRLSKVELESFIDAPPGVLPKRPATGAMEALKSLEKSGEVMAAPAAPAPVRPAKAVPPLTPAKGAPLIAPQRGLRHPTTPGPEGGIETEQVGRADVLAAETEQALSEWPPDLSEGPRRDPDGDDDTHLRPWVVGLAALVIGSVIATVVALTGPKVPEPATRSQPAAQPLPMPAGALAPPDASLAVVTPLAVPDASVAVAPLSPGPARQPGGALAEGIAVDSVPPGASAQLAQATCRTPCLLAAPPGIHVVRVELAGREPWAGLAEVRRDVPARLLALLKAPHKGKQGALIVHANALADVYLDGKEAGKVAGDPILLPPGSYQVMLVNPGKRARPEASVVVRAGKTTQTPVLRFR